MKDHPTSKRMSHIPFPFGWYSWGLGDYRPSPFLYWVFDYELLPPLPTPDPTFRFLAPDDDTMKPNPALDATRAWLHRHVITLTDSAARRGITLPESFIRFMRSPELQACVRSGCWGFILSNQLVPCPDFDGGYLVGFLREQQDCVIWCLCLTRDGQSCVVAVPSEVLDAMPVAHSEMLLGYLEPDESACLEEEVVAAGSDGRDASGDASGDVSTEASTARDEICICAPSFTAFIYRFWIETEIDAKLNGDDKTPLTDAERSYVEHYAHQQHIGGL
jgi:hypothetical protein